MAYPLPTLVLAKGRLFLLALAPASDRTHLQQTLPVRYLFLVKPLKWYSLTCSREEILHFLVRATRQALNGVLLVVPVRLVTPMPVPSTVLEWNIRGAEQKWTDQDRHTQC